MYNGFNTISSDLHSQIGICHLWSFLVHGKEQQIIIPKGRLINFISASLLSVLMLLPDMSG